MTIQIPAEEIELKAIRAQGPGGQNVNKVSSAIHLRFDVNASSLPEYVKTALLKLRDKRLTSDGCIVIKAQQFRTQEQNRIDALRRLDELVASAATKPKVRRATKPTRASQRRRLDQKSQRSTVKSLRRKPGDD
jgi:ribosome-associated protein